MFSNLKGVSVRPKEWTQISIKWASNPNKPLIEWKTINSTTHRLFSQVGPHKFTSREGKIHKSTIFNEPLKQCHGFRETHNPNFPTGNLVTLKSPARQAKECTTHTKSLTLSKKSSSLYVSPAQKVSLSLGDTSNQCSRNRTKNNFNCFFLTKLDHLDKPRGNNFSKRIFKNIFTKIFLNHPKLFPKHLWRQTT